MKQSKRVSTYKKQPTKRKRKGASGLTSKQTKRVRSKSKGSLKFF